MKEIHELKIPDDLLYAKDHEWLKPGGEAFRVGISDYAQDQLGDVVFVELPQPGDSFEKSEPFGTVESVKAVSELYMPVGGEIVEINEALGDSPELVNKSPYDGGWLVAVKPSNPSDADSLMKKDQYLEMLKGMEA